VASKRGHIGGIVLFPGAGADRDHSSLLLLEKRLRPLRVARVDFPYRRAGRRAPDRAPVLMDCVRDEVERAAKRWKLPTSSIVIGGRSMGGRMCSMVVADEEDPLDVGGLILISYPLNPPGRADAGRAAHLGRVRVPTLFVSGTRDQFFTKAQLRAAARRVKGSRTMRWIDNKRHDLKGADEAIADHVESWLSDLGSRRT